MGLGELVGLVSAQLDNATRRAGLELLITVQLNECGRWFAVSFL